MDLLEFFLKKVFEISEIRNTKGGLLCHDGLKGDGNTKKIFGSREGREFYALVKWNYT